MNQLKILITIVFFISALTTHAQTGKFTLGKKDTSHFRGFGIGFEYFSGHQKLVKILKFRRDPIEEFKIGKNVYITYFNLNQKKKFHYYIDGGFIFWNNQKLNTDSTLKQRSEILQFTGSYKIGKIRIIGRIGGLLNHNSILSNNNSNRIKNNEFGLITGVGLSVPIHLTKVKGLSFTTLISRVNKNYTLSGTIFIPLIFH